MTRLERYKTEMYSEINKYKNHQELNALFQLLINKLPTFREKEDFINFYEKNIEKK